MATESVVRLGELNELLKNKCIKISSLADKMGITPPALYNKLNGNTEFNSAEIKTIIQVLGMSPTDVFHIFFSLDGELK